MSSYSDVNVSTLLSNANKSLTDLDKYDLYDLDFGSEVLNSKSKKVIDDSIKNIMTSNTLNGSIYNLKTKLNNLVHILELIQKIQTNERQISQLEKNLYYYKTESYTTTDDEGNETSHTKRVRVMDKNVKREIESLQKENSSLEREVNKLLDKG